MKLFTEKNLRALEVGLALQIALQFLVGGLLATQYHSGSQAYASVHDMRQVKFWSILAGIHYWGSSLLILSSLATLFVMIFTDRYRVKIAEWYGALVVFLGAYGAQLSGNVLPMDRHGVQTANIETGLMSSVPIIGKAMHNFALAGTTFSPATASRWFLFHEILITILLLVGGIMLLKDKFKSGKELITTVAFAPIAFLIALSLIVPPPLGNPAAPIDYTQFEAYVSWYTWPLHGMLQVFTRLNPNWGFLGFGVVPGLFVAYLLVAPFAGKKFKKAVAQAIPTFFCLAFLAAGLAYGGPIAKLTGNRDPAPIQAIAAPTTPMTTADLNAAKLGRGLFNSQGCSGCHGKDGDNGSVGPTLTNEQQLESATWVAKFIRNPKSIRPSSTMPAFSNLTTTQANQIAAWICLTPAEKKAIQSGK